MGGRTRAGSAANVQLGLTKKLSRSGRLDRSLRSASRSVRVTTLAAMDREDIARLLGDYTSQATEAQKLPRFAGQREPVRTVLNQKLIAVNKILRELAPDLLPIRARWIGEHGRFPRSLHRAARIVQDWRVFDAHQQPDSVPVFPLNLLDQVVAEAAISLWRTGKYRQAVNDAATAVNSFAQGRIGRHDISDKDLMALAFSDSPPEEGKPRLRCPGNRARITVRSQQEGARAFAIGTFQGIRNPAAHLPGDWNPVTAFHHLAALSQVVEYFRNWEVQRYVPPAPDTTALLAAYQTQLTSSATNPTEPQQAS